MLLFDNSLSCCDNGNAHTIADPKDQDVESLYDLASRIVRTEHYAAGGVTPDETREFTYDNVGNVLTLSDIAGDTVYVYDELYRVVTETRTNTGENAYLVASAYDLRGNRKPIAGRVYAVRATPNCRQGFVFPACVCSMCSVNYVRGRGIPLKEIALHEITDGLVLAADVMDERGGLLLSSGAPLMRSHVELLEQRGVLSVRIVDPDREDESEPAAPSEDDFESARARLEHMFDGLLDDPIMRAIHSAARGMLRSASGRPDPSGRQGDRG